MSKTRGRRGRGADAGGRRTYQIIELVTYHELREQDGRSRAEPASRRQRVAQASRGVLGRHRIREDSRRPFHAELVAEVRDDLPVPVELGAIAAVERAGVQRDAVGRVVAGLAEARQRVDEQLGQRLERLVGDRAEVGLVRRRR